MAENKTKPTDASVDDYLSAIFHEGRRKDCETVSGLMSRITRCKPRMWGPSIVGFDRYHYRYASGREGDACIAGFSSRKEGLCVYLLADEKKQQALLGKLGRHKMGKCCLYIRKLEDVDMAILEQLISESVNEVKRRYGNAQEKA